MWKYVKNWQPVVLKYTFVSVKHFLHIVTQFSSKKIQFALRLVLLLIKLLSNLSRSILCVMFCLRIFPVAFTLKIILKQFVFMLFNNHMTNHICVEAKSKVEELYNFIPTLVKRNALKLDTSWAAKSRFGPCFYNKWTYIYSAQPFIIFKDGFYFK